MGHNISERRDRKMSYQATERVKLIEKINKTVLTGEPFVIFYRDIESNMTLRKVIPIRLKRYGAEGEENLILSAFCCLRMDYRHFQMDRIIEAYFRDVEY